MQRSHESFYVGAANEDPPSKLHCQLDDETVRYRQQLKLRAKGKIHKLIEEPEEVWKKLRKMLLPTVKTGGIWSCRQIWDMLMSPISPRNLRTTALLTSIYQMVSPYHHHIPLLCKQLQSERSINGGAAHGPPARRRIRNPAATNVQPPAPKYKNYALDMQSHTPLSTPEPIKGGNVAHAPTHKERMDEPTAQCVCNQVPNSGTC